MMTTDEKAMFNQLECTIPEPEVTFRAAVPPPQNSFSFTEGGDVVGKLEWKNGTFTFTGDADEAAKIFFASIIKVYHTETALLNRDLEELRTERDKLRAHMETVLGRAVPILKAATGAGSWNAGDAMDAHAAASALLDKLQSDNHDG